jgi:flagellar M-ring protein FliF
VTLYRDLELSGAGSITDNLTKNAIAYRLEDGGSTVLVSQSDVARARVLLAKDGLPTSGRPGMELFDKPSWGMTDFTQRITYRRAMEGELSRTIGTLRGVDHAQVHLALPESSPLRKLERPAEAAVVVSLKPGVALGPEVVQGIAYIVSNSVEQLPAENVAVMDDSGRLLSVPSDNAGFYGLSTRQLELQRSVEHQLGDKVEGMLATVVGAGQARVQVSALLNFEQVEKTIESYDPDGAVLGTEQRSETTPDGGDSGSGAQTVISNSYQNSKKVERIIGSVGNINRLTVAVLVNQKALGAKPVADLEAAVRNAIGIDSARGDRLTLTAMPFEIDPSTALSNLAADTATKRDVLVIVERFTRPGLMLIGIVAALILGLRLLKSVPVSEGIAALGGVGAAAMAPAPPPQLPELPAIAPSVSTQLRARIQADSAEHPNTAAQVMRAWLAE